MNMDDRRLQSTSSDSFVSSCKRKKIDLDMDSEGTNEFSSIDLNLSIVNHPLVLIKGELVGDGILQTNGVSYSSAPAERIQRFPAGESRQEVVDVTSGAVFHSRMNILPLSTVSIPDDENSNGSEIVKADDVSSKSQKVDTGLNELAIYKNQRPPDLVFKDSMLVCQSMPLGSSMSWPVSNQGKAKVFVPLNTGENVVTLKRAPVKDDKCTFKFLYEPLENKRFVRPVYVICANSDGTFECPIGEDNSVDSAKERIAFNARLLQTFMAEQLNVHGFGRQTFRLEEDDDSNVKVNIFHSKLDLDEAIKMSGDDLYGYFLKELNSSDLYDPMCKFWTFMSCTRYQPPNPSDGSFDEKKVHQYVRAHTALGGGNMALFGTGCLHTWARTLEELYSRFTDTRDIDRKCLFDDSANRGSHWANYATTLGAAMHELGHTFNLPHTPSGIMGRGFDDMNCFFVGQREPQRDPIKANESHNDRIADGGAHWHRSSAAVLSCSRWIGEHRRDDTPVEVVVPLMYNCKTKRGPLGRGTDQSGESCHFDSNEWLEQRKLDLRGFRVSAKEYVNAVQIIGTDKSVSNDEIGVVSSQWFGNDEAGGETHEFILSKDERLTSIDVRAGLWVDAIRLNSSHKSSGWIGGKGGDLYNLSFGDGRGFDDIFGTAGREHVTSIGITRVGDADATDADDKSCYFYSPYGVRVVEAREKNGEVIKHWEFLDVEPNKTVSIDQRELFLETADSIAIYDSNGECGVYDLESFKSNC